MIRNKSEIALILITAALIIFGVVGWLVTPKDEKAYGADIKTNLAELLEALLQNKGSYRIRIGMMNPQYLLKIYDEFIEVFTDPRIYKFLHIPLQSGSDRILKLMGRGYSANDFVKLAKEVENAEAPAALTGLKDTLINTSYSYLSATQSALVWVSDPSAENLVSTETLVKDAQLLKSELENSTWTN